MFDLSIGVLAQQLLDLLDDQLRLAVLQEDVGHVGDGGVEIGGVDGDELEIGQGAAVVVHLDERGPGLEVFLGVLVQLAGLLELAVLQRDVGGHLPFPAHLEHLGRLFLVAVLEVVVGRAQEILVHEIAVRRLGEFLVPFEQLGGAGVVLALEKPFGRLQGAALGECVLAAQQVGDLGLVQLLVHLGGLERQLGALVVLGRVGNAVHLEGHLGGFLEFSVLDQQVVGFLQLVQLGVQVHGLEQLLLQLLGALVAHGGVEAGDEPFFEVAGGLLDVAAFFIDIGRFLVKSLFFVDLGRFLVAFVIVVQLGGFLEAVVVLQDGAGGLDVLALEQELDQVVAVAAFLVDLDGLAFLVQLLQQLAHDVVFLAFFIDLQRLLEFADLLVDLPRLEEHVLLAGALGVPLHVGLLGQQVEESLEERAVLEGGNLGGLEDLVDDLQDQEHHGHDDGQFYQGIAQYFIHGDRQKV